VGKTLSSKALGSMSGGWEPRWLRRTNKLLNKLLNKSLKDIMNEKFPYNE